MTESDKSGETELAELLREVRELRREFDQLRSQSRFRDPGYAVLASSDAARDPGYSVLVRSFEPSDVVLVRPDLREPSYAVLVRQDVPPVDKSPLGEE